MFEFKMKPGCTLLITLDDSCNRVGGLGIEHFKVIDNVELVGMLELYVESSKSLAPSSYTSSLAITNYVLSSADEIRVYVLSTLYSNIPDIVDCTLKTDEPVSMTCSFNVSDVELVKLIMQYIKDSIDVDILGSYLK